MHARAAGSPSPRGSGETDSSPLAAGLVAQHHVELEAQPALLSNTNFLKEKITLMCLTQTLFQRTGPGADRIVPFAHIATAAKLRMEEVEICP